MKCDVEGNVWCTGARRHLRARSRRARCSRASGRPAIIPTNFAWGDDDWKSLYITKIGSVVRTRINIAGRAGAVAILDATADKRRRTQMNSRTDIGV